MARSTGGGGLLQACGAAEDHPRAEVPDEVPVEVFVDVSVGVSVGVSVDVDSRHRQIRVDVARQLSASLSEEWQVSTACMWSPGDASGSRLYPDLVVHRPLGPDGLLPAPPILAVEVGSGPGASRAASAYARFGVDHYWHLDSSNDIVEVSVRVDDEYRRAETLPFARAGEWIDFGVGIVWLTLPPPDSDAELRTNTLKRATLSPS